MWYVYVTITTEESVISIIMTNDVFPGLLLRADMSHLHSQTVTAQL